MPYHNMCHRWQANTKIRSFVRQGFCFSVKHCEGLHMHSVVHYNLRLLTDTENQITFCSTSLGDSSLRICLILSLTLVSVEPLLCFCSITWICSFKHLKLSKKVCWRLSFSSRWRVISGTQLLILWMTWKIKSLKGEQDKISFRVPII